MNNPSLRQEPRYEPATVIPLKQESSLIDWLIATNRLIPREKQGTDNLIDEEEDFLMDPDDNDVYDVEEEEPLDDEL
ncbi:MAG: DUF3134 domain-containing protein [Gomphosphaeria aponina SAG 52.96 = DSM 107014]|uniref:DUF3134 domain-containing protein n=1 Tax=Gomphosphaeria aponina SAG 52.96 = DSM 107014 TaxID=1521640 RepID=A0A941GTW0_9CHRO|nr:DUF3134 domain-containing protein [Gomphosphaeria aponina SAG 52.96 = DSM 107014]